MSRPRIVVIGSANMDLIVRAERIPAPGETILGGVFVTAPGGKGANQAVAAARLGADTYFVARIGRDPFGDEMFRKLTEAGVHNEFLFRDADAASGIALIGVDAQGQNAILVAPGANARLSPADIDRARETIAEAAFVVLQLEIPLETVAHAIAVAHAAGTPVLLNPAPAQPLSADILRQVDVLTPNAHEAAQLLGLPVGEQNDTVPALRLMGSGVRALVITLGAEGCLVVSPEGRIAIPAVPVVPVDTTAAGDCFSGALAVALAEGKSLEDAARFATQAAAISVTRVGAIPSLPTRAEVDRFAHQV